MIKTKLKLMLCLFLLIVLCLGQTFATEATTNIISEENTQEATSKTTSSGNFRNEDLYVSDTKNFSVEDIVIGNAFISTEDFTLDPNKDGGIITGNLFATSSNVTIKSDVTYSDSGELESVNSASSINGNAYIVAEKFVLEPGCEINGDLYIVAKEIEISQNSIIYGNIFAVSSNFKLNGQVGGDLYLTGRNFNMDYYGFVYRDLHLSCKAVTLNGVSYRNCFADVQNFSTSGNFVCNGNLTLTANTSTISGEVSGNANIKSKNLNFKTTKDGTDEAVPCKIGGKLDYSSNKELESLDGIVIGEKNFSKYSVPSSIGENLLTVLISFISLAICVVLIYLLLNKFSLSCLEKLSKFEFKKLLISLGIGLLSLIVVPIILILLLITVVGVKLSIILSILFVLICILSVPTLIVALAKFLATKCKNVNIFVWLLTIPFVIVLIKLIPFAGFIVSTLLISTGFGKLVINCFNKKS